MKADDLLEGDPSGHGKERLIVRITRSTKELPTDVTDDEDGKCDWKEGIGR